MENPNLEASIPTIKITWRQYDKLLDASAQVSALLHVILAVPHLDILPEDVLQNCLIIAEQLAYKHHKMIKRFHPPQPHLAASQNDK